MARAGINAVVVVDCPGAQRHQAMDAIGAVLARHEAYRMANVAPDRLQFARTFHPRWALVLGVPLAPVVIGVFLLLHRTTETCTAIVEADHRGARVKFSGRVEASLLEELRRALTARETVGVATAQDVPWHLAPQGVAHTAGPAFAPNGRHAVGSAPATGVVAASPWTASAPQPDILVPAQSLAWSGAAAPSDAAYAAAPAVAQHVAQAPVPRPVPASPPAPAPPPAGAVVALDDGRRVAIIGRANVGRAPDALGATDPVALISMGEDDFSVSKTHVALLEQDGNVWVADLISTNGSVLVAPDGAQAQLPPNEWVHLPRGGSVLLGRRYFRLEGRG